MARFLGMVSLQVVQLLFSCFLLDESVLLDLKHLLAEAKQKIPPFLAALEPENEELLNVGGRTFLPLGFLQLKLSIYLLGNSKWRITKKPFKLSETRVYYSRQNKSSSCMEMLYLLNE